ncbi:quinol dehydrogenase ferredoxin subunit NapH [Motiliproteus sediminis]|uniref:quinol dehydrogenase ferredoxin subunit NapH n=1 Tax=Motiliproteus sediminis TaxID=1468178 RepID=UPI001AF02866|nr:quinol dehydrogenase ferredoxin subunit NapH [Motiliproteus sediminis]
MLSVGSDARRIKGFWRSQRWLLLRRLSQLGVLVLFLAGPLAGVWLIKGNLSSSLLLETIPLSDPFIALQVLASGHQPETNLLIGIAVVALFYLLLGGRVFCSWVCPINPVTDLAAWCSRKLGIRRRVAISRHTRFWILALCVVMPLLLGMVVWELVNPVSQFHRGLIFSMGSGWLLVLALFLFDLFVLPRGWCGHLCPQGACYSLLGHQSLLRVRASGRERCYDCLDCYAVCPEPQVIKPALKGAGGDLITSSQCTNCGRCIDICSVDVFAYGTRPATSMEKQP